MNVVIIGNGIAGVSAAETVRAADKECGITVVSAERYPFYSRPRLIELVAGRTTAEQMTIHAPEWYDRNAIELLLSTSIVRIDTAGKTVFSSGGAALAYDSLVVAAGASCIVPPVEGFDEDGVFTLRTVDDAERIRERAAVNREAVVVGGGLLGLETANSMLALGVRVQVLEVFDRLLPRQLDIETSAVVQGVLEKRGMLFRLGTTVRAAERHRHGLQLSCSDGKEIAAGVVVVSAGIKSNCSLVDGTAIERERGVIVDDRMRTNVPDVYACGDVAEHRGVVYGLWQPAREQGIVCGSHVAGREVRYGGTVTAVRLKVAGIELASIGEIECRDGVRSETEKDEAAGSLKKVFLRGRTVVGAILIGNTREAAELQRMIKAGE